MISITIKLLVQRVPTILFNTESLHNCEQLSIALQSVKVS